MKRNNSLLHQKSLCVITGASRGIGKEIALRLSSNVGPNSYLLLLSRNEADLQETARQMRDNSSITCDIVACDISKITLADFDGKLQLALRTSGPFDVAFVVHNAGSTGDISRPVTNFESAEEIKEHLDTNVVSFIILNNAFLRMVGPEIAKQRVVINITSLLAIKSVPGYGLYPIGKAAREAFTRSLTAENKDLRVINYSPGPVKTAMADYVATATWDSSGRQWWREASEKGALLTTEQTVAKLLRLLDENTFENASHVDYYDIP